MRLIQTKSRSRKSGGPQYYFHDLSDAVVTYLRKKRAVPVALVTPYGATPSHFIAVGKDAKLEGGRVVGGKVEHDRIQQGRAEKSIGEAIRDWYTLETGDFEWIEIDVEIHDDKFYVAPLACKMRARNRTIPIQKPEHPLSFHRDLESQLWRKQLRAVREGNAQIFRWAISEIGRVVAAHERSGTPNVMEQDILRASGALSAFGMVLGPYLGKGLDCKESKFSFLDYPTYTVPVEVKKRSGGFKYQQEKYSRDELSRVVVLCVTHDLMNVDKNTDVVELSSFVTGDRARS